MNLARLLYPVKVLGPEERLGLWLCGCSRRCPHCCNPELWERQPQYELTIANIMRLVNRVAAQHPMNGFTISGGEPMEQARELADLLARLSVINRDILVYSGYTLTELRAAKNRHINAALAHTAVLIDGPYMDAQNTGLPLRGSENQNVRILKPEFATRYHDYLAQTPPAVQNFAGHNGVISAGIHKRGFDMEIDRLLQLEGIT